MPVSGYTAPDSPTIGATITSAHEDTQSADLIALYTAIGADETTATTLAATVAAKAPLASPALTGNPTAPTPAAGDNDTSIATTAFVTAANLVNASIVTSTVQTGGSYTLALTDAGTTVEMNSTSGQTVSIPLNSAVAFPVGTVIGILQYGTGQVTFSSVSGVTLRSSSSYTTRTQYSGVTMRQRATNEWVLEGDLS